MTTDDMTTDQPTTDELDVRPLPKPQKHPAIFSRFDELAVGESFVLVNDHDPRHLHDELDREQPGAYGWEYLHREPREVRVRITRLASTPLPRVLMTGPDLATVTASEGPNASASLGAAWKLPMASRDLDANLIVLPPHGTIEAHQGPELDVLLHVVVGSGTITTERDDVPVSAGDVVWLPRRSRRAVHADDGGLRYLAVHQRRRGLQIASTPPA